MNFQATTIAWRRCHGGGTATGRTLERNQTITPAPSAATARWAPSRRRPIVSSRADLHFAQRHGLCPPTDRSLRRQRRHLLAASARLDRRLSVAGPPPTHPQLAGQDGRTRPVQGGDRLAIGPGRLWGGHTGPNPVDRAKNGCKRHVLSDAQGLPLLLHSTPANVRDEQPVPHMLKNFPPVQGPRGRPRRKPGALVGDRGYGFPKTIAAVLARGIVSMLAPRGTEHGSGLGKVRYVIERSMAWFGNWRRLRLCYEKTGAHWQAYNELAAIMICFRRYQRILRGGL